MRTLTWIFCVHRTSNTASVHRTRLPRPQRRQKNSLITKAGFGITSVWRMIKSNVHIASTLYLFNSKEIPWLNKLTLGNISKTYNRSLGGSSTSNMIRHVRNNHSGNFEEEDQAQSLLDTGGTAPCRFPLYLQF